jgi:hypothetical protein
MGKSLLGALGAIAAIIAVTVLIAGCTSLPNTLNTHNATNVTVKPAERSNTTLTITSSSPTDPYLGDQVVTTGRLVDAKGNGIPNQTIIFKDVARALVFTYDYPVESVKTNSTGAFKKVGTVSAHDTPSSIKEVVVEGWIEYAGNDLYKPATTPHRYVTVHLT